jgi:hypothetical protein
MLVLVVGDVVKQNMFNATAKFKKLLCNVIVRFHQEIE